MGLWDCRIQLSRFDAVYRLPGALADPQTSNETPRWAADVPALVHCPETCRPNEIVGTEHIQYGRRPALRPIFSSRGSARCVVSTGLGEAWEEKPARGCAVWLPFRRILCTVLHIVIAEAKRVCALSCGLLNNFLGQSVLDPESDWAICLLRTGL
jgi:hypothetical protein